MRTKTPLTRSQQMARIKNKDTSPEVALRKALWAEGMRYRRHGKTPFGRPDILFPGKKVAVFIDGCFWHGCPIHYVRPRSRGEFWSAKLVENVGRDCKQTRQLEAAGWRVLHIWEHQVFTELDQMIDGVRQALQNETWQPETNWRVFKVIALDEEKNLEKRYMLDLRDSDTLKAVEGKRYTTKWKVPKDLLVR